MANDPRYDLVWERLAELKDLVHQLLTQAPIGYSTVTEGNFDIMSDEGLRVFGSELIVGLLDVIGRVRIAGLGILEVQNLIDLFGSMIVRAGGSITIQDGALNAANVTIEENKITIGGASPIVIESVGGQARITVGGATLTAEGEFGAILELGSFRVIVNGVEASLSAPGVKVATRDGEVIVDGPARFTNLPTTPIGDAPGGSFLGAAFWDASNVLRKVIP
ncbi:hypothetical protein [Microbacterium dauci]|uniref:Uncharacterized protein n=1 Tax=Microbacterium dauci TaxID=3048008 RepID=A0ABT6ZAQ3_9MICO|nr:hypothetical protein [Microbacterium sp. LX3-4]MDJ1113243.1 hypothetical protein [Microbacterium sp. LX3-4]